MNALSGTSSRNHEVYGEERISRLLPITGFYFTFHKLFLSLL